MRKQLKNKKRSCKMCKPHKMGWDNRWTAKEQEALKIFEKERRQNEMVRHAEYP